MISLWLIGRPTAVANSSKPRGLSVGDRFALSAGEATSILALSQLRRRILEWLLEVTMAYRTSCVIVASTQLLLIGRTRMRKDIFLGYDTFN